MKYSQMLLQRALAIFVMLFITMHLVYGKAIVSDSDANRAASLPDFASLAKKVSPSVVNISTLVKPKQVSNPFMQFYGPGGGDSQQQIPLPDLFRHFFERQSPSQPSAPQNKRAVPRSLGSGFIMSADGYIMTNYHVVKDADEILVRLKDRREFKAKLIGDDEKTDLALLKIEAKDLPILEFGDSDKLEPGQWVFAIGSPFGFSYSVTKGIVSALNRSLPNESYIPFIQTDVPINPGNSGGPLISMQGKIIGINSQIYTRSGGFMGVSFAIPIDEASFVARQLQKNGKVTRGWLGVIFQDVDQGLADSFKLKHPEGALVSQVMKDSPAMKSGFKPGDIILEFNGKKIEFYNDLPVAVGRVPVGTKTSTVVWREGKRVPLSVVIDKKPDEGSMENGYSVSSNNKMGLKVQTLSDKWRQDLDLPNSIAGVVVTEVLNKGIGIELGLIKGDVITQIGDTEVINVDVFNKIVQVLGGKKGEVNVAIRIIRQGVPMFKSFVFSNK